MNDEIKVQHYMNEFFKDDWRFKSIETIPLMEIYEMRLLARKMVNLDKIKEHNKNCKDFNDMW